MILLAGLLCCYTCGLLLYKPAPASFKDSPPSFIQHTQNIKATLLLGILLIVLFGITTDFTGIALAEQFYVLTLSKSMENPLLLPLQVITHNVIHLNSIHLISNIFILMLLSCYERRVGAKRFLMVLTVATAGSVGSIFFLPENVFVCGLSGGILGLGAALFTDNRNSSSKEWFISIATFLGLFLLFTIQGELQLTERGKAMQTDHIGHILGIASAVAYCRCFPIKEKGQQEN